MVSTIALLCLVLLCTPVQLDCTLTALQADLLFTPVNTCSVYSLEALQANFEDPFLEPPTPVIDSVIATGPDIIQLSKTGEKEVATDEGADPVQASSPESNPKLTQSNMNDDGTNAAITAKEANERAPDENADSVKAAPPKLNPKLTKPGENDAATEALAAEAKATASDQGTSLVVATAAELNPNPTKPTANDAVIDATSMVEDSEVMVATVPDYIRTVLATNDDGGTVSQGQVSQPPSVDQMLLDLKRKIAKAEENKSSDAIVEGSVEPAMVSLSASSTMPPSPGFEGR
jgi:hypothetical protein